MRYARNFLGTCGLLAISFPEHSVPVVEAVIGEYKKTAGTAPDSVKTTPCCNHEAKSVGTAAHGTLKSAAAGRSSAKPSAKPTAARPHQAKPWLSVANKPAPIAAPPAPEEPRKSLDKQEAENWNQLINRSGLAYRERALARNVIEGTLTSSASVVTYKDLKLHVKYLSSTGQPIKEEDWVVYKSLSPGGFVRINQKLQTPPKTDKVEWDIIGAESEIR